MSRKPPSSFLPFCPGSLNNLCPLPFALCNLHPYPVVDPRCPCHRFDPPLSNPETSASPISVKLLPAAVALSRSIPPTIPLYRFSIPSPLALSSPPFRLSTKNNGTHVASCLLPLAQRRSAILRGCRLSLSPAAPKPHPDLLLPFETTLECFPPCSPRSSRNTLLSQPSSCLRSPRSTALLRAPPLSSSRGLLSLKGEKNRPPEQDSPRSRHGYGFALAPRFKHSRTTRISPCRWLCPRDTYRPLRSTSAREVERLRKKEEPARSRHPSAPAPCPVPSSAYLISSRSSGQSSHECVPPIAVFPSTPFASATTLRATYPFQANSYRNNCQLIRRRIKLIRLQRGKPFVYLLLRPAIPHRVGA